MALVIKVGEVRATEWQEALQQRLPAIECRLWDDAGDPDEIDYAVVWQPPPGGLKRFSRLKCIISIGAGVDHVFADPELPPHVPIIRTTAPALAQRMREYVLLQTLRLHRHSHSFEAANLAGEWRPRIDPLAFERRVGIMGLGRLGSDCAASLAGIGFDVAGWARRPKTVADVQSFDGKAGLRPFLARTDILVCLLPLTEATEEILDRSLFEMLPQGASLINVGRGEHVNDADLLAALDEDLIDRAVLDVFRIEPLPKDHPFWSHERILVTPHIASLTDPENGGEAIAANLKRFIAGLPVPDLVDRETGY